MALRSANFGILLLLIAATAGVRELSAQQGAAAPRGPRPQAAGPRSKLPPIPLKTGPLALQLVYPSPTDVIDAGDSSFVFGQIGDGRAKLTINGQEIAVARNGAFLGWIRIPTDTIVSFELEAVRGNDTLRATVPARRTVRFTPPTSGPWLDTMSVQPRGRVWWPANEPLPIRLRAAPGSSVWITFPGVDRPLMLSADSRMAELPWGTRAFETDTTKFRARPESDRYAGSFLPLRLGRWEPLLSGSTGGLTAAALRVLSHAGPVPSDAAYPTITVMTDVDTVSWKWPIDLVPLDQAQWGVGLDDDLAGKGGTDSIVVGRALPGGTYYYFFPTGTRANVTGRLNGDVRLSLSAESTAWVSVTEVGGVPLALPTTGATVGSVRLTRTPEKVSLRIPVSWRVPFKVLEEEKRLTLTFFGARGDVNWIQYGPTDTMIRDVRWSQPNADEVALTVDLAEAVWGYRTRWDGTDLLFEVKRPPRINAVRPLAGLKIVVDAGHPPAGATGPTGLRESEANLAIAKVVERMFRAAGATVLMTRKDSMPVDLTPRVLFADSVGADLLVSIHNNALPDGVNPFTNSGTSVYYNQPRSLAWARPVEAQLVRRLGIQELGVGRGDLALVRPTWMPSILTEGMFLMIPEQENALRSASGQRLYAQAVVDGTLAFLRDRARAQTGRPSRP